MSIHENMWNLTVKKDHGIGHIHVIWHHFSSKSKFSIKIWNQNQNFPKRSREKIPFDADFMCDTIIYIYIYGVSTSVKWVIMSGYKHTMLYCSSYTFVCNIICASSISSSSAEYVYILS